MWTRFMDMHSGGGLKEKWSYIYIEASEGEAKMVFYNRFGHNPDRVTCTCCGHDYSMTESETLLEATGYERGCGWDEKSGKYVEKPSTSGYGDKYRSLDDYLKEEEEDVLIIRKEEIRDEERGGELPDEGYIWH